MGGDQRWVEDTVDPVTGESLRFEAATEAELDAEVAGWFGEDPAAVVDDAGVVDEDTAGDEAGDLEESGRVPGTE